MKKLSFSLPSKPNSKPPLKPTQTSAQSLPNQQFITEFNPTDSDPLPKRPIPSTPDDSLLQKPSKKPNFIPTPSSNGHDLSFESEIPSSEPTSSMSYGLNIRKPDKVHVAEVEKSNNSVYEPVENVLLKKFKDDLKNLPEDKGMEEFEDMPVEGFGAALLGRFGWKEGMGIGKNAKEDVKIVEPKRLSGRGGLGFREHEKEMMSREKKKRGKGEVRNEVGSEVRIVRGKNVGVKGKILEVLGNGVVVLRVGKEEVEVRGSDVASLGSKEEESCLRKLKERKEGTRGKEERRSGVEERKPEILWLRNHIRVRVISKDLKRGRLYLKKGRIVDVVGPTICDISMDEDKELVQGVSQEVLETALPRRGGLVLVLYGKHKGVYGSLVEKDPEKETGVVQDADTHSMVNVRLEQIAEYVGDPSDLGY